MQRKILLGKRWVGKGEPCLITVDIGPNHNQELKIAKKLIDKAAEAKADAIKFQVYSAEKLYSKYVPQHSHKSTIRQSGNFLPVRNLISFLIQNFLQAPGIGANCLYPHWRHALVALQFPASHCY